MRHTCSLTVSLIVLLGICSCSEPHHSEAPVLDLIKIKQDLLSFVRESYPEMQISVQPWEKDSKRLAICFVDEKFSLIYPQQRFHYLSHMIPADYQERYLQNSVWFELAPSESPTDLRYPDDKLIEDISADVLKVVNATRVFEALDDELCPNESNKNRIPCYGDYRNSRKILLERGFTEDELFDVFHVFMAKGGYCDCEILYNVAPSSRLAAEYWKDRAKNRQPHDPHHGR